MPLVTAQVNFIQHFNVEGNMNVGYTMRDALLLLPLTQYLTQHTNLNISGKDIEIISMPATFQYFTGEDFIKRIDTDFIAPMPFILRNAIVTKIHIYHKFILRFENDRYLETEYFDTDEYKNLQRDILNDVCAYAKRINDNVSRDRNEFELRGGEVVHYSLSKDSVTPVTFIPWVQTENGVASEDKRRELQRILEKITRLHMATYNFRAELNGANFVAREIDSSHRNVISVYNMLGLLLRPTANGCELPRNITNYLEILNSNQIPNATIQILETGRDLDLIDEAAGKRKSIMSMIKKKSKKLIQSTNFSTLKRNVKKMRKQTAKSLLKLKRTKTQKRRRRTRTRSKKHKKNNKHKK